MRKTDPAGNPQDQRHVFGPRPIGALVPALTRPAFKGHAPGAVQLMSDWAEIVGPALATMTSPRRFAAGTLTLACSGPVALELQHLAGPLMERINAHLGRAVVTRLRFVQDMTVQTPSPASAPLAETTPVEVPDMAPGPLRDALSALGGAVGGRRRPEQA